MKILIVNGSPKGKNSITLHTCLYIQKHFPNHEYKILNVGQIINNMNPVRTMRFERHNRISQGHKITVKYAFSLTV